MAIITGKTEFARRVVALGLTLTDLAKMVPYSYKTLNAVSCGQRKLSIQLDWALKQIESAHASSPTADNDGRRS